ncbi:purine-nucleoside phosphorylase [Vibrio nitrifigilis]|uniref:Purine nucleoside permease n=1 Tax=Vibrio nitrifigilis TaxID=2789781 RepID=A0ABS0GM78_9VIBR|nr:purine nucleoside permease [Vibrio nitrifigilis]MBF9003571.1 purine nucleoside permease [Vibrio nitrifigilis]
MKKLSLAIALGLLSSGCVTTPQSSDSAQTISPKVLIVTMFGSEAKPWLETNTFTHSYHIAGLSAEYPELKCNGKGICLVTTAMGYANAASTMSAVALSPQLNLRDTYFIISGIGGVDPNDGTLGSANWARYVIDGGLIHEIDSRQIPQDWTSGLLALGATKPSEKAKWSAGTEVYKLNDALVNKAYKLTANVALSDGEQAQKYRQQYKAGTPGAQTPKVSICDTLSSDTYWHGSDIAKSMQAYTTMVTNGKANYCTTQMEDNASLTALKRGAEAGKLDFNRILVMRTGSNFDREAPNQTPIESLSAKSGGYMPAVINAYRVSNTLAQKIVTDWPHWENGVK